MKEHEQSVETGINARSRVGAGMIVVESDTWRGLSVVGGERRLVAGVICRVNIKSMFSCACQGFQLAISQAIHIAPPYLLLRYSTPLCSIIASIDQNCFQHRCCSQADRNKSQAVSHFHGAQTPTYKQPWPHKRKHTISSRRQFYPKKQPHQMTLLSHHEEQTAKAQE